MKDITDPKLFAETLTTTDALKSLGAGRDPAFDMSEKIFFMDQPDDIVQSDNLKLTISPDGRNKVIGAARLLSSTEPIPTVTREGIDTQLSGQLEEALIKMWVASGRAAGVDIHYDGALAALLYASCHLTVILTSELVKTADKASPANKRRLESLAAKTPLLFRNLSPRGGYPRYDEIGLDGYYREDKVALGAVRKMYGELTKDLTGGDRDVVVLCSWWDLQYHFVWLQGGKEPFLSQEHELPFIPVAVAVAEGSRLFAEEERRLQPFLYTLWKSGLHQRQSLSLTTIFTKLAQFGASPLWMVERGQTDGKVEFDFSGNIPMAYTNVGDRVVPSNASMIDQNLYRALDIANTLAEASTIYGQTLGQPLAGGSATFSATALLAQSGRLPLVATQKCVARAISDIFQIGLEWMGLENVKHPLTDGVSLVDPFNVEVDLDVKMPQDVVKNAGMFSQLQGRVSEEWLYSNLLQITDPDKMRRTLAKETAYKAKFDLNLQLALQKIVQQNQPTPPPGAGQVPPGGLSQPPNIPTQVQGQNNQNQIMQNSGMPGADGSMQAPMPTESTGGGSVALPPNPFTNQG